MINFEKTNLEYILLLINEDLDHKSTHVISDKSCIISIFFNVGVVLVWIQIWKISFQGGEMENGKKF